MAERPGDRANLHCSARRDAVRSGVAAFEPVPRPSTCPGGEQRYARESTAGALIAVLSLDQPRNHSMSTSTKSPARKGPAKSSAKPAATDAIEMLTADHKEVKALFKQYDELVESDGDDDAKGALADEICQKLSVHAALEEELFYPAAREVLGEDEDLVDEADVEHATAKDLIAQLEGMNPGDALYDAKVKVLGEYIDHHVKEEEGEMFPKVKKGKLDGAAIGLEMADRKAELLSELGVEA
jgi:hemerythrin superfamily protein